MSHHHHHDSSGNLKVAFFLNLFFTIIEVIGGIFTNSIAILSDAVHDLGDSISLGLAWYFDTRSKKEANFQHTYGYRRLSLVGGLITAFVLVFGISFVLWQSIARLLDPQPVNAPGMILIALLGIAFNGAAVLRVKKGSSLTEQVVSWHLLEDLLGWVAVLIGAIVMSLWDLPILDPLLSIGIALFVLWNIVRSLRKIVSVFLQVSPADFDQEAFEKNLDQLPSVLSHHHTHSWSIDGEKHVLTTHLVLKSDSNREEICATKSAVRDLLDPHSFEHVTIGIELEGEECEAAAHGH